MIFLPEPHPALDGAAGTSALSLTVYGAAASRNSPNSNVLIDESTNVPRMPWSVRRSAAAVSANRITLLRDADRNGVADIQGVFPECLNQPRSAWRCSTITFHIGNTDGVVAPRRITATGGPWLTLTAIWPASRHAQAI